MLLTEIFHSSFQANVERVPLIRMLPLPSKSFAIPYAVILQFFTVCSKLQTEWLNGL